MGDLQKCADGAIGNFVKSLGGEYWPDWAGIKPTDWGADAPSWRRQAGTMVGSFEDCIGFTIDAPRREIDVFHDRTLSNFSDYLYEKGLHHSAVAAVDAAKRHLEHVESTLRTFVAR